MHKTSYIHNHVLTDKEFSGCCLDCDRSFKIIKKHILNFYEEINVYGYHDLVKIQKNELYRKYQLLDDITNLQGGDNLSRMILRDNDVIAILPKIRSFYKDFFDIHEKKLAEEICLAGSPWEIIDKFELLPRYKQLVRNQLDLIKSAKNDRVIFIGCGPLPTSLIVLNKYFGITCCGVDSSLEAVDLATKTIKKLNLQNGIKIYHGNESDITNIPGNIIVVAAMALPKRKIFESLLSITEKRKKIKILYRTYTGLKQLLHISVSDDDINGFVKSGEIVHSGKVNNTLVLLSKEN